MLARLRHWKNTSCPHSGVRRAGFVAALLLAQALLAAGVLLPAPASAQSGQATPAGKAVQPAAAAVGSAAAGSDKPAQNGKSARAGNGWDKGFDHLSTGFALSGQHENVRCEDCHVRGIFKGTPKQCASCHLQGALVDAVFMPSNHFPISSPPLRSLTEFANCGACHTTSSFYGAHFAHDSVLPGTCAYCHGNFKFANGVSAGHVNISIPNAKAGQPAQMSCDACHSTISFALPFAVLPTGHIPTSQPCATCHAGGYGAGRTVMNHTGTEGMCTSCHAPGQTPMSVFIPAALTVGGADAYVTPESQGGPGTKIVHIPTGASCDQCHANLPAPITYPFPANGNGFASPNSKMLHAAVAGQSCSSCHYSGLPFFSASNGTVAPITVAQIPGPVGSSGKHFPINGLDCANSGCHLNTSANDAGTGTGTVFSLVGINSPVLGAAGHTAVNLPCETCHDVGISWKIGTATLVTATSAHIPPNNVAGGGSCGTVCHTAANGMTFTTTTPTTGFGMSIKPVMSVAMHNAPGVAGVACDTCHEAGLTGFLGITTNIFLRPTGVNQGLSQGPTGTPPDSYHTGTTLAAAPNDCKNCHTTTPPFSAAIKPSNHIPLNTGVACLDCHAGGYAPGASTMKHADVTQTACTTCHNVPPANFMGTAPGKSGGQPWPMSGNVATVGTSASTTHFPINGASCSAGGCHVAVDSPLTDTGAGFALSTATPPILNAAGHASVNAACETCHEVGMAASWKGITTMVTATSAHIPPNNVAGGGSCGTTCHTAANGMSYVTTTATTGFGLSIKPVMNVAMHAAVATAVPACTTCHEAGDTSFLGITTNIYLRPTGTNQGLSQGPTGTPPDTYHTGTTLAAAPNDCKTCHTTTPPFSATTATLPAGHIKLNPSGTACADCHSGGYAPGASTMKHADVNTFTCTSCHNISTTTFLGTGQGTNGQPWQMSGAVASVGGASTTHFPLGSASDCVACHAAKDPMTSNGSGFALSPLPSPVLSAAGHGTVGATGTCVNCHATGASWKGVLTLVTPASPATNGVGSAHVPIGSGSTTVNCGSCHTSTTYLTGAFVISGTPKTAPLMNVAAHTAAAAAATCDACHEANLSSWLGIGINIFLRPNNSTPGATTSTPNAATGLSNTFDALHATAGAASATADCAGCHSTAPPFTSTVLPAAHIKLNPASASACNDCHVKGMAPGLSTMLHADVNTYTCASCHNTTTTFSGTGQGTNGQPWQMSGAVASVGGASTTHFPLGSASDCVACHAAKDPMTSNGAGFALSPLPSPVLSAAGHSTVGATGTCSTCHASGSSWKGVLSLVTNGATTSASGLGTTHIPIGSGSTTVNCGSCHTSTTYLTGAFVLPTGTPGTAPVMNAAMHTAAAAASTCDACHEANLSNWLGVGIQIYLRPSNSTPGATSSTPNAVTGLSQTYDATHATTGAASATGDCSGCHTTSPPFSNATTLPTAHIKLNPTGTSCLDCHTAGYGPGKSGMKHADVNTFTCISCHNSTSTFSGTGQGTNGQPWQMSGAVATAGGSSTTHFPLGSATDCSNSGCHLNTTANDTLTATGKGFFITSTNPVLSAAGHGSVGATGTCSTCHASGLSWKGVVTLVTNGATTSAAGLGTTHIPIGTGTATVNCGSCHTSTTYLTGAFVISGTPKTSPVLSVAGHTAVATATPACDSCHEAGMTTWLGVGANIFLRPNIAAATNTGLSTNPDALHTASTTADCGGCHSTAPPFTATALPANHIPLTTGYVCTSCHLTGGVYYNVGTTGTGSGMSHTYVSGTCSTCHGATAPFYAGSTFTPVAPGTATGGGTFGTQTTGLNFKPTTISVITTAAVGVSKGHVPLTGAAGTAVECNICHTSTTYVAFGTGITVPHNTTFITITGSGKSSSSKPTCVSCHAPSGTSWYGVSKISVETMGSHQGSSSSSDCINCHSESNFAAAAAAAAAAPHRQMARASMGPAVRPIAPGLPGGISTGGATSALPAIFTHVGVLPGSCAQCHSPSGGATPMPSNHMPTMLSCDSCHRTSTWLPALFAHNGIAAGSCGTCHTGTWATAKPANHMLTNRTCDTCHHSTSAWAPEIYSHLDTVYTQHPLTVTCVQCHVTNTEAVVWKFPNLQPGCGGCHGGQFRSASSAHRPKGPAAPPPR